MVVIWAETRDQAEAFRRSMGIGRGVIVAGNQMARTLDGLRPTAVVQLDGAGEGPGAKDLRAVLDAAIRKSQRPVPWFDLRGKLVQRDDATTLLHQYSEWLDGQGLVLGEEDSGDERPHDALVRAFLADRSSAATPAVV